MNYTTVVRERSAHTHTQTKLHGRDMLKQKETIFGFTQRYIMNLSVYETHQPAVDAASSSSHLCSAQATTGRRAQICSCP